MLEHVRRTRLSFQLTGRKSQFSKIKKIKNILCDTHGNRKKIFMQIYKFELYFPLFYPNNKLHFRSKRNNVSQH